MKQNRNVRNKLLARPNLFEELKPSIELIEGSSANVDLPNNYADFTITSPPYWDVEYYGDEPEQLGNSKTYDQFLCLLLQHVVENYRILKPGSFCCWCVNDFRKNGKYLAYHSDLIPLFINSGFILHAIYIIDFGGSVGQAFVQTILERKTFPKQHEYCLVFRKGDTDE